MSRKFIAPLLTILLIGGVGWAIYLSMQEQLTAMNTEVVKGLSGSEKIPFFHDQRTIQALQADPYNLHVEVEKAGSRQIATQYNLAQYSFAFTAGIPAAEKIKRKVKSKKAYQPFFTPMVIASWKPIAEILEANGMVKKKQGTYYIIDMNKLFDLIIQKKRWTDLQNSDAYPANKTILITTTDIRKSNSAAMYLAIASYILNGNAIVQNEQQANQLIEPLSSLFMRQGFTENSSAVPFQDYLIMGAGKTPMVMIYEAQFLYEASLANSALADNMVLLYPEPTLYTKHVLIPMAEQGEKLGEALTNDPNLQSIATSHGLRTGNIKLFREFVKEKNLNIPDSLVNVIEPPNYEVLEYMIQRIEERYQTSL